MWAEFRPSGASPEALNQSNLHAGPSWAQNGNLCCFKADCLYTAGSHGTFHSGCSSPPKMRWALDFTASRGPIKGWGTKKIKKKKAELLEPVRTTARAPLNAIIPFPCSQWLMGWPEETEPKHSNARFQHKQAWSPLMPRFPLLKVHRCPS